MKVLLVFGYYGDRPPDVMEETIRRYRGFKNYDFHIVVMTAKNDKIGEDVEIEHFEEELGHWFLWEHQAVIADRQSLNFDLLMFSEDDIRLTEDNFNYFVEHADNLKDTLYHPGFLRFEVFDSGSYLVDMNADSWKHGSMSDIKGTKYWTANQFAPLLPNTHQGCFLFTRRRFKELVDANKFYVKRDRYGWGKGRRMLGIRECATNWMYKLYYRKAWAIDDRRMFIHHCIPYRRKPTGMALEEYFALIA